MTLVQWFLLGAIIRKTLHGGEYERIAQSGRQRIDCVANDLQPLAFGQAPSNCSGP